MWLLSRRIFFDVVINMDKVNNDIANSKNKTERHN